MDEIFNNAPISVSVIDYLGKIEDGVGLLLSIVAENTSYEMGYWFNKEGHIKLIPEPKLLEKLEVNDIYQYKYIYLYFHHYISTHFLC